jgi:hypothetical protein
VSVETENRRIQAELDQLSSLGLLTPAARARIGERYAVGAVDLSALARWFTVLGAVAMAAGAAIFVEEHAAAWFLLHRWPCIEGGLTVLGAAFTGGGAWLRHRRGLPRSGGALELLGTLTFQGLLTALAIHHSTGSDDWPALVGVQTVLAAVLAYALRNRTVLVLAGVQAFVWFGGSTGYASGWGAWWLGMTYPARFLAAGAAFLAVAWLHARHVRPPWQGFARVYAHLGMLDAHLALWFLSVFGWFDDTARWAGTDAERLAFSAVWAGFSVACVLSASRLGLRLLRGYGLTFLLVDVYTFYFQFVAWRSAELWFVHLLVLGGALVAGGIFLERQLGAGTGPAGEARGADAGPKEASIAGAGDPPGSPGRSGS